jgi:hypothetical protein
MAPVYLPLKDTLVPYFAKRAQDRIDANGNIAATAQQLLDLAASPGGRVLAGMATATFAEFYQSFITVFSVGAFSWIGSQSMNSDRVLETLDGTRTSGECAILATAFWALWRCPAPFGMGQQNLTYVDFNNGNAADGFISYHPPGGVRALGPNIRHPHGAAGDPRNCLYNWGNHKILQYNNGTYYDPTYRKTYLNTNEMVAFAFTGHEKQIAGETVTQIQCVTPNATRGWRTGDLMYLRSMPLGIFGPYRAIGGW